MTETPLERASDTSDFARQWHYRPDVPIRPAPVFAWPPRPIAWLRWTAKNWFALTENVILVMLAVVTWAYLQPPLEKVKTLEFGWIAQMYLRNLVMITLLAGGLHLWFHVWKRQKKDLKFDPREQPKQGRSFTFNAQLWDNVFWTLGSGVAFWTGFEVLMLWAMANGYAPVLTFSDNPVWFVALLVLTPIWISFHFYWIHRALHWPPLYRLAHALHHRNTNIGPWSGISMHPIEHLLFFSSVLIHWLLAAHPVHILFHMQHQALTGVTSHTGFDALLVRDRQRLSLGNFHHQMHHRYFECNYGNLEMPWDTLFGSFHDGTDQSHQHFKARRRLLARKPDRN